MPKFKTGAPQVTFRKKNGRKFTMTYHSRDKAAKAVRAWRNRGGKVVQTSTYTPYKSGKSIWGTKSGLTQRSGKAVRGRRY